MKTNTTRQAEAGFSILELLVAMTITLAVTGAASVLLARTMTARMRENQRTEALADAQRALNLMSREIANAGFGLNDNGLVTADCNNTRLHFRANLNNANLNTSDAGEDMTFGYQSTGQAIIRYDRFGAPQTTSVAGRIDQLRFTYTDYVANTNGTITVTSGLNVASANTGRVTVTVSINLPPLPNNPATTVTLRSDVTLRNSAYMLTRY